MSRHVERLGSNRTISCRTFSVPDQWRNRGTNSVSISENRLSRTFSWKPSEGGTEQNLQQPFQHLISESDSGTKITEFSWTSFWPVKPVTDLWDPVWTGQNSISRDLKPHEGSSLTADAAEHQNCQQQWWRFCRCSMKLQKPQSS